LQKGVVADRHEVICGTGKQYEASIRAEDGRIRITASPGWRCLSGTHARDQLQAARCAGEPKGGHKQKRDFQATSTGQKRLSHILPSHEFISLSVRETMESYVGFSPTSFHIVSNDHLISIRIFDKLRHTGMINSPGGFNTNSRIKV
jgi:hypothetical protein